LFENQINASLKKELPNASDESVDSLLESDLTIKENELESDFSVTCEETISLHGAKGNLEVSITLTNNDCGR
jgi:hypothetical protein